MTFLLGSEYCLQSLSNDVGDVQSCIKDIIVRVGKINSISWKFPDKYACDLDIDGYLINYKYDSNDNENNQVSHIILLELIIDRVCLLLQLHCESIEKIISKESHNSCLKKDQPNVKMISPCLGLTSKKHWNKLCQLSIYIENINKELSQTKKSHKDLLMEMENMKISKANILISNGEALGKDNISKQACDWLKTLENDNKNHLINRKTIAETISKDVTFKSSQTVDTAFKPCESCHISQTCLREASSLLMRILKDESQSSSLTKLYQELVTIDWLSDKKILQIKDSFSKDLDKICKHFRIIRQNEIKTKEDLVENQKLCDQLKDKIEKHRSDMCTMESKFSKEKGNLESEINDYVNQIKQFKLQITTKTEENNSIKLQTKKEIVNLTQELTDHKQYIRQLDEIRAAISNFNVNAADPLKALCLVKEKISEQTQSITRLNSSIEHQKSINENLTAEECVFKEKEEKLVKRLQNLTNQKRKLEEKLDILQDQLESNQESLRVIENQKAAMTMKLSDQDTLIATITKAKDEFNIRINELQDQVQSMKRAMDEVKQEKTLLLNYPDLNGPVEKFDSGKIENDIVKLRSV